MSISVRSLKMPSRERISSADFCGKTLARMNRYEIRRQERLQKQRKEMMEKEEKELKPADKKKRNYGMMNKTEIIEEAIERFDRIIKEKEDKIQKLRIVEMQIKRNNDIEECTFRPKTNSKSKSVKRRVEQDLINWGSEKVKRNQLKRMEEALRTSNEQHSASSQKGKSKEDIRRSLTESVDRLYKQAVIKEKLRESQEKSQSKQNPSNSPINQIEVRINSGSKNSGPDELETKFYSYNLIDVARSNSNSPSLKKKVKEVSAKRKNILEKPLKPTKKTIKWQRKKTDQNSENVQSPTITNVKIKGSTKSRETNKSVRESSGKKKSNEKQPIRENTNNRTIPKSIPRERTLSNQKKEKSPETIRNSKGDSPEITKKLEFKSDIKSNGHSNSKPKLKRESPEPKKALKTKTQKKIAFVRSKQQNKANNAITELPKTPNETKQNKDSIDNTGLSQSKIEQTRKSSIDGEIQRDTLAVITIKDHEQYKNRIESPRNPPLNHKHDLAQYPKKSPTAAKQRTRVIDFLDKMIDKSITREKKDTSNINPQNLTHSSKAGDTIEDIVMYSPVLGANTRTSRSPEKEEIPVMKVVGIRDLMREIDRKSPNRVLEERIKALNYKNPDRRGKGQRGANLKESNEIFKGLGSQEANTNNMIESILPSGRNLRKIIDGSMVINISNDDMDNGQST